MAPPHPLKRLSSTSSQHTTQTPRLSLSTANPNVFSDENALEPFTPTPDSTSSPSDHNRALQTSSDPLQPPAGQLRRQSSVIEDQSHKRRSAGDNELSIDLRRERSFTRNPNHRTIAASLSETSKASTSNTSAFAMPQTQSPYQGATGPSHPYGMYPQDIGISRTPSTATIPSARAPERTRPGVDGPTQPYGMYPQNTVPEDEIMLEADVVQPMPGFPGRQRNYQRRFGPDSDEAADIVGPDGYTEQLPAYTRYANDIPPKATNPKSGTRRGEPRNQPGESRDTLNTMTSEDSDPRSPVVADSSTRLTAPAAGVTTLPSEVTASPSEVTPSYSAGVVNSSEGGHFKELVKARGKRRVCFGKLPMWLCMVFLVVGACVVGGMIGGILGRAKASSESAGSPFTPATFSLPTVTATVTATSLVDAEPISSPPADLPALIPGQYSVPLQNATSISNGCMRDTSQIPAWDCTSGARMELNIAIVDSVPVVLFNSTEDDGPLSPGLSRVRYGAQPPILNESTTMSLMNAKDYLEKGPAYVFHKQFDKLVILPEDTFDNFNLRRQRRGLQNYNYSKANYAPSGDKPWFCYWNGTLLEGFIFVTQTIATHDTVVKRGGYNEYVDSTSTVSPYVTPANYPSAPLILNTYPPDSPSMTGQSASLASSTPVSDLSSRTGASANLAASTPVSDLSSTTGASAILASSTPIPAPPDISELESATAAIVSEASSPSSGTAAEEVPADDSSYDVLGEDQYPTVMKIEERRDHDNPVEPYCQQMLVMKDGSVQSIDQRKIDLTVDVFGDIQSRRSKKRGELWKKWWNLGKREDDYGCVCKWILEGP